MKGVISFVLCLFMMVGCKSTSDLAVVTGFDADQYVGIWYEAARYPHRFEKGMSNVSATYSFNEDGTIKVLNKGYIDKNSKWKDAHGVAKFKGDEDVGSLKVSFFRPFYGAYKIVYLDDDYTKAIVSSSSYNYLWILVRDPSLDTDELENLVVRAEELGFERSKIIMVDQSKNQ